jgi:hypothetical protein
MRFCSLFLSLTLSATLNFSSLALLAALAPSAHADDASVQHMIFYPGGLFANQADCLAVLPAQAKLFQQQTGLTAISTNCIPGTSLIAPSFSPQINYTGTPAKYLYFADTYTTFTVPPTPQSMSVLHSLIQGVGTIAIETSSEIAYYRSEPPEISNIDIASFSDSSQCASQVDAIQSAYSLGGVPSRLAACFSDDISHSTTLMIGWTDENTTVAEDHSLSSVVYSNFAACMSAKNDAITGAKATLPVGKHIWGGVCEPHLNAQAENDGFAIDLFSDNF